MSDGVKMVFKALLGTIAFIVLSSLCIELFNINITGMQIRQMTKMAAKQAAMLFTQENYKIENGGGALASADVLTNDGNLYLSGDFYLRTNPTEIWESIYDSDNFRNFCTSSNGNSYSVNGTRYTISKSPRGSLYDSYTYMKVMKSASNNDFSSFLSMDSNRPGWDDAEDSDKVKQWDIHSKAKTARELMYTPINVGIPYLDSEIMNRMFKWNAAQLLSNCDSDLIMLDENGNYYVNYKGFRAYPDQARILAYEYYVYDLANSSDRNEFTSLTGMKVNTNSSGTGIKVNTHTTNEQEAEDNYVAVVSITYDLPISYEGITPIKNIFNYVWDSEVAGMTDANGNNPYTAGADIVDTNGIHEQWDDTTEGLTSGNTSDYIANKATGDDVIFTTGYLTYTIIN